jgi:hypothetical protein
MIAVFLLACTTPESAASLEGTWSVDGIEFDGITVEEVFGSDWSGTVEVRATGVGFLDVTGSNDSLSVTLEAVEQEDGGWQMGGTADGLYLLDLDCTVVDGLADCLDSGETDWANEDSDTHVTLLSLSGG